MRPPGYSFSVSECSCRVLTGKSMYAAQYYLLPFFRWFLKAVDVVAQERGINAYHFRKLRYFDFLMGKEKALQGRRFCILGRKTVKADIFIQRSPMNATKAELIISTIFVSSTHKCRIPKQGLAILPAGFIHTVDVICIKPYSGNFHDVTD